MSRPLTRSTRLFVALAPALLPGCLLVTELDYTGEGGASASVGSSGGQGGGAQEGGGGSSSTQHGSSSSSASTGGGDTGGGGGGGGAGGAATGGASSTGSGGGGGADDCGGADLATDPENCGTCGFGCASGECTDGRCGEVVDLGSRGDLIRSVLVHQDRLFLVQQDAAKPTYTGKVLTLPLDFASNTAPVEIGTVTNVVGSLTPGTVGTHRVYFAGQSDVILSACSTTSCETVDFAGEAAPQLNGLAPVGTTLYLLESSSGNRVLSAPIDPTTGVPEAEVTPLVTEYESLTSAGVLQLVHDPVEDALYWAGYDYLAVGDGCVYRAAIDALPLEEPVACWSPQLATQGFVVDGAGTVYVQDGPTTVRKLTGDPPTATLFATDAKYPRAVDDDFLYVAHPSTNTIRAVPLDGAGPEVDLTPTPAVAPYAMDARHPRYVYVTAGAVVHRVAKPRR